MERQRSGEMTAPAVISTVSFLLFDDASYSFSLINIADFTMSSS